MCELIAENSIVAWIVGVVELKEGSQQKQFCSEPFIESQLIMPD